MEIFSVGGQCPFNLPQSGTLLRHGEIICVFKCENLTDYEAQVFQWGQWWFSLRQEQGHIVLCPKIKLKEQDPPWIFEFMFSLNKTPKEHWNKFFSLEVGQAYWLQIMLVESKTNTIKAMRTFGLSRRANQFLKEKFIEQSTQQPVEFDLSKLPSPRKSFDSGFIKEKAGTK